MTQQDRDREQELASAVKAATDALVYEMREPMKANELPDDVARRLLDVVPPLPFEDQQKIRAALAKYTEAVNALWVHAINTGVVRGIVSGWMRRNRKNLAGLTRAEYESAATLAIRTAIIRYRPGAAGLRTYATGIVENALDAERGQALSPIELPVGVAREKRTSTYGEMPAECDEADPEYQPNPTKLHLAKRWLAKEGGLDD
jgi:hypothetical protein